MVLAMVSGAPVAVADAVMDRLAASLGGPASSRFAEHASQAHWHDYSWAAAGGTG